MFLIDSHCHLDRLNYKLLHRNVDDVLNKAIAKDIKLILSVCTTLNNFNKMIAMIGNRNNIRFTCGIHPIYIDNNDFPINQLRNLSMTTNVVAIGETGLDYYHRQDNKLQQQNAFLQHIILSSEQQKPIIVHTRNARSDTIMMLTNAVKNYKCRGVLHSFTGDINMAKIVLDLGLYISFSGIITFSNASTLHEIVRYVPLDRMLIETDSPYLTPVPYRGKENQPAYVRNIAEYISKIKNISLAKLATTTTNNFATLFNVDLLI